MVTTLGLGDSVHLPGFLPRHELRRLYSKSRALLAPLLDDEESRARFPTKIAEYLLTGRPVISTALGEVANLLSDGQNAFLAKQATPEALATIILRLVRDPSGADRIGQAGREYALLQLGHVEWGARLSAFLCRVRSNLGYK